MTATYGGLLHQAFRLSLIPLTAMMLVLLTSSVCQSKPTLSFPASLSASFPSLSTYTRRFVERTRSAAGGAGGGGSGAGVLIGGGGSGGGGADPMKAYSGYRVSNESLLMIYWHDQTIAIVELGPNKLLLGCEIIEIYEDKAGQRFLHKLSDINRPLQIKFNEMIQLMDQCQIVDRQNYLRQLGETTLSHARDNSNGYSSGITNPDQLRRDVYASATTSERPPPVQSPLTLLSGIIPGTKWCGTGDIASTYADLGAQTQMDRCCRSHDLCPLKVRSYQTRYGLENNSIYTKSHCVCDDRLFSCLKRTNTSAAQVMGSIYFNLVQVPCVAETEKGAVFRNAREGF